MLQCFHGLFGTLILFQVLWTPFEDMIIKALVLPSKQYIMYSNRIEIEEDTKDFVYLCEI